jgi:cob(I)alamin adenosyltransferase
LKHNGDLGETGYLGQGKLSKGDLRFETLGSLEEVQASLGIARVNAKKPETASLCLEIQKTIPLAMAEVASDLENAKKIKTISAEQVQWIDSQVSLIESKITIPHGFIIPGKTKGGAVLDLVRAIVRQAERNLVRMQQNRELQNPYLMQFWNRLSLFCYYLELFEDQD